MKDPLLDFESLKGLAAILSMSVSGLLARKLISDDDIDWQKFTGEVILAIIASFGLWSAGLLQGLNLTQMILLGSFSGMGSVKALEWFTKLYVHIRKIS